MAAIAMKFLFHSNESGQKQITNLHCIAFTSRNIVSLTHFGVVERAVPIPKYPIDARGS